MEYESLSWTSAPPTQLGLFGNIQKMALKMIRVDQDTPRTASSIESFSHRRRIVLHTAVQVWNNLPEHVVDSITHIHLHVFKRNIHRHLLTTLHTDC